MLTDALLGIAYALANTVFTWFPAWTINPPSQLQEAASFISGWNQWVPATEIAQIFGLVATVVTCFIGVKVVIKVVDWIMDVIP